MLSATEAAGRKLFHRAATESARGKSGRHFSKAVEQYMSKREEEERVIPRALDQC